MSQVNRILPLASIIIPTYNQARYLPAAVESALAQDYPALEIIVVDDGSNDETSAILGGYGARIVHLRQENRGLAAARNTGYRSSHGEYLLFLDSDDCIPREKLSRHIAWLNGCPEAVLAYSAWRQLDPEGRLLGEAHPRCPEELLPALLRREFFFFASSAVIRRAAFEQAGGFDESLRWSEDADLWLRLAKGGAVFGYLDEPLLDYRVHTVSMTAAVNPAQAQGWLAGLEKFFAAAGLPESVRLLRREATAILHFETAGRYLRAGQSAAAGEHLRLALGLWSPHADWFLEWAAGTALDPRTPNPQVLITAIFAVLPDEAAGLHALRQRAIGRMHTSSVFAAIQSRNYHRARCHLLPALRLDPAAWRNRGFWKAMLVSVTSMFTPSRG